MKIVSIEPTPNPNSMKLNLDTALPEGASLSYSQDNAAQAPDYVQQVLAVPGVKSLYRVADFIALERQPHADWQRILAGVRRVFEAALAAPDAEPPGRVNVFLQVFRGIPMQVKLVAGSEQARVALPERFARAATEAAMAAPDYLAERKWVARGARYGEMQEIGEQVAAELAAAYDDARLAHMLELAKQQQPGETAAEEPLSPAAVAARLADPDWRVRYAALHRLEPEEPALDVIVRALDDPNISVRRLATAYLGEIGGAAVLPHLLRALKDQSAAVRRAAGDCLSDLGDPQAIGPMCEALQDSSKLVRWRAARFLYEVGDASALPALRAAEADPEFEVQLQVKMAIERIEAGRGTVEPAWKQLTRQWSEGEGQGGF